MSLRLRDLIRGTEKAVTKAVKDAVLVPQCLLFGGHDWYYGRCTRCGCKK